MGIINLSVLLISILLIINAEAARILVVVPTPSISHQIVFRPLVKELVNRGHEVTYITTDSMYPDAKTPKNLTEIDLHDMSYKAWRDAVLYANVIGGSNDDMVAGIKAIFRVMVKVFELQMKEEEVKQALTKEYDLLIIEAWMKPAYIISHFYKDVPTIMMSSLGGNNANYEVVGAPVYPILLYPKVLHQRIFDLTIREKLIELYNCFVMGWFYITHDGEVNDMYKRLLGPNAPTVDELEKNFDMFFANHHPLWDMNRPAPPSMVYIGGIHMSDKVPAPLPKVSYFQYNTIVINCLAVQVYYLNPE